MVFAAIGLASLALFCGYNYALTGDPFQTGYQRSVQFNGDALLAGRLPAPWPLPTIYEIGHTILRLNFWSSAGLSPWCSCPSSAGAARVMCCS